MIATTSVGRLLLFLAPLLPPGPAEIPAMWLDEVDAAQNAADWSVQEQESESDEEEVQTCDATSKGIKRRSLLLIGSHNTKIWSRDPLAPVSAFNPPPIVMLEKRRGVISTVDPWESVVQLRFKENNN